MFVKIHKNIAKSGGGSNKGSSSSMMNYLDKENEDKEPNEWEHFFNHDEKEITKSEAQKLIDGQNKNIGKNDAKFYMFTINPSPAEQEHLLKIATEGVLNEKGEVKSVDELTKDEKKRHDILLKSYTKNVMEIYANNFNKGVEGKDLVYVAKIEHKRVYKFYQNEVKENNQITKEINNLVVDRLKTQRSIKESTNKLQELRYRKDLNSIEKKINKLKEKYHTTDGKDLKEDKSNLIVEGKEKLGNNTHMHIVVHRNTKEYKKISPNAPSRGHVQKNQDGTEVQIGFDHEKFKVDCNKMFQEQFNYKSKEKEIYKPNDLKKAFNRADKKVEMVFKNNTIGRAKRELKNQIFDKELLEIQQKYNQSLGIIKTLAKVTNPKALFKDGAERLIRTAIGEVKSKV